MTQVQSLESPFILPKQGFVKASQILQAIPVSSSTWWNWVKIGKAPQSIKLGANTTVWKAEDIHNFIEELARPVSHKPKASKQGDHDHA